MEGNQMDKTSHLSPHGNSILLDVKDLATHFYTGAGVARAVDGVSFQLEKGRTLAVVGESGCGKSVMAQSLMRLFRIKNYSHPTGSISFNGQDLLSLGDSDMQMLRGHHMAMIFQEPMSALNPTWKIKDQIAESLVRHKGLSLKEAYSLALELITKLGVPSPQRVLESYPHTLSGGMRQRVAIAMALACKPDLLIADEPTTALDVTIQAQILRLLRDMQADYGMAIMFITHDLGVVNEIADDVLVMYSGRVVEYGPKDEVLFKSKHPYTRDLMAAVPKVHGAENQQLAAIEGQVRTATRFVEGCRFAERCRYAFESCKADTPPSLQKVQNVATACFLYSKVGAQSPFSTVNKDAVVSDRSDSTSHTGDLPSHSVAMRVENLKTWFPVHAGLMRRTVGHVKAVDDISFDLIAGKTLAIVGESGCGKTTMGLSLLRLIQNSGGRVVMESNPERSVFDYDAAEMLNLRRTMQVIFQDPFASLNPRFSVREIIEEGLLVHTPKLSAADRDAKVIEVLQEVGLPKEARLRYPHEFSGGQRQRIAIARAIILKPKILVLDEATSALDVSIQAQILNLLKSLQSKYGMTMMFITHNLGVVRYMADYVCVMYLGRMVEYGPTDSLLSNPAHPYTRCLIDSVPTLQPGAQLPEPLVGDLPNPLNPPHGCSFHPRCPKLQSGAVDVDVARQCSGAIPSLSTVGGDWRVSCHAPFKRP
jgi:peptide/nickel transport system ATP-binding protein